MCLCSFAGNMRTPLLYPGRIFLNESIFICKCRITWGKDRVKIKGWGSQAGGKRGSRPEEKGSPWIDTSVMGGRK